MCKFYNNLCLNVRDIEETEKDLGRIGFLGVFISKIYIEIWCKNEYIFL